LKWLVEEWLEFAMQCLELAFWAVVVVFVLLIVGALVEVKTGRGWL